MGKSSSWSNIDALKQALEAWFVNE
jgi:hypothetical protein